MDKQFEFLMYKSAEEDVSVNALIKDETIWLTQKSMAELFDVDVPAISKHLSNIYTERRVAERFNYFQNGNSSARRHSPCKKRTEFL